MPKKKSELPSTLKRSDDHAKEIFIETHESALDTYDGDEERAHRVAYAALKHSYKKQGDRWVKKGRGGSESRDELYERAKELDIRGRSKMNKEELATAIREHR